MADMAGGVQVHPAEEHTSSGCSTCGSKFKRFSHRKKLCKRCGDAICGQCVMKSPKEVTRTIREVKKSMCSGCNALVIVPFMSEVALSRAPAPQLSQYLQQHQVDHERHAQRSDLERMVGETRRSRGWPDRETITGARSPSDPPGGTSTAVTPRITRRPRGQTISMSRHHGGSRRPMTAAAASGTGPGRAPHPSITNLLLAEHLLGQLLMAIDGQGGAQQSDEAHQEQQREMREKHKKDVERQRIAAKLQTAKSEEEFRELRVADLKIILEVNQVDHSTMIEKEELLNRVIDLWQSTQAVENMTNKDRTCKICMDAPSDCVFLECGHLVTCVTCGEKLKECPMCRSPIVRTVRVFET